MDEAQERTNLPPIVLSDRGMVLTCRRVRSRKRLGWARRRGVLV